ncbi:hypothetical protein [Citrobacter sp. FP75]|uniref:hypothetical protein n=1 Tax=Citrobacter sp. FP75 TaxID=1852949 RepID=UPI001BC9CB31|nr:hypothetical protein [Citrobacter sp. FP75]
MNKMSSFLAIAFFISAGVNAAETSPHAQSFAQMNEHEKAMVVHQSMNNGHSYAHEQQAEKHRAQANRAR